ncbi:MAG: hypothetical protein CMH63_00995 [Nanoarchaeota archaeon]|nr:hypothetical protein [Nanoarchaeota archaeon]|tara:strand:+ start:372 stop:671 length:300 start_codon:yes stop_codon:yes gene_type:complete
MPDPYKKYRGKSDPERREVARNEDYHESRSEKQKRIAGEEIDKMRVEMEEDSCWERREEETKENWVAHYTVHKHIMFNGKEIRVEWGMVEYPYGEIILN